LGEKGGRGKGKEGAGGVISFDLPWPRGQERRKKKEEKGGVSGEGDD